MFFNCGKCTRRRDVHYMEYRPLEYMLFSKTEGFLFFAISTEVPRHSDGGNYG